MSDSEKQSLWTICEHRKDILANTHGVGRYKKRQPPSAAISKDEYRWLEIYVGIEAVARPMNDQEYMLLFAAKKVGLGLKQMNETETEMYHNLRKQAYHDSKISYYAAYKGLVYLIRTKERLGFVPEPADIIAAGFKYQKEISCQKEALRDIFTNVEAIEFQ